MKNYSLELLIDVESAHKKTLEKIKNGSVVLEIGCNQGHMSSYLKEKMNCTVSGVDIDSSALEAASSYLDTAYNIDCNDVIKLDSLIPDNYYDYILATDVLEHLQYPDQVLKILTKKLKISGKFVISVPNASHNLMLMSLLKNDFTYQDVGFFDNTHIKWFTSDTFAKMLNELGLIIELHDFVYMTPEYEPVQNNRYEEFGLLEREVLLKHKNGHFFQNIFVVSKDENSNRAPVQNIDAYWFDCIQLNGEDSKKKVDVFDACVNINISEDHELNFDDVLDIVPTMRLRGIKNINLNYLDSDEDVKWNIINGFEIDQVIYSFSDMKIRVNIESKRALNLSFEYVDVNEDVLKSIFKLGSQCRSS